MHPDRIVRLLPEIFRTAYVEGGVLNTLLTIMDDMHAPSERVLDELDRHFDPLRAPAPFLLMLSAWLGYDRYLEWSGGSEGVGVPRFAPGLDRLRTLLAEAPELERRRGTRAALERFLELATGLRGFRVDENPRTVDAAPQPFHISVTAPNAARRYERLVEKIVEDGRPAYVTYTLTFAAEVNVTSEPRDEPHAKL